MRTQGTLAHQIGSGREYSTMKVGQQQNKRKNAKILAVMLVFFALRMQPQGYRIQTDR